ncbi:riboflavin synthase [Candidatus Woesearchaeota archaeon CG10_big_fil_rev_8_21_14_0_10_34_8]|nr:MAG: riboflavin synthase [Candidatus Woesearchaeota archaeon CG10_big_fil_rev_8_21_14_0_10_34_8]
MKWKIGVADTTFARINMFKSVEKAFKESEMEIEIVRYTVPGIKDLGVACKLLLTNNKCDIAMALGMPGSMSIDKQCSHEATIGIQHAQLMTNKHILEVFVHLDEEDDPNELIKLAHDRAYKHAQNALALLKGREILTPFAGKGLRQGKEHVGSLEDGNLGE